jgi:hypothetical protein
MLFEFFWQHYLLWPQVILGGFAFSHVSVPNVEGIIALSVQFSFLKAFYLKF